MLRLILNAVYIVCFFIESIFLTRQQKRLAVSDPDQAIRSSFTIVTKVLRRIASLSGVRLTVKGLENVPKDQPVLFIGNHRSLFDIVTLFPLLPNPTTFIGKNNLEKVPLVSDWMRLMRCPFLDRTNTGDGLRIVKESIQLIREGVSVCVFPEGTRTPGDEMLPFKEGTFMIAQKTGCPVVPVAIMDTERIFENHKPFIHAGAVTICFGEPVDMASLDRSARRQVPARVQETIADLMVQERK
jgi:1-acyl-sn-glycerol-3-phosphate acyltransferase